MWLRIRCGRRLQATLKLTGCALIAAFYFTFLFRQSMQAFEQNKDRGVIGAAAVTNVLNKQEFKQVPRLTQKSLREHKTTPAITTAPSTLNPVYEYSAEIHSATEKQLLQRLNHLNDVCQRHNLQSYYPPNPWEFFISPGHNLVWCNVFKAASSTWMYYFNILGGYDLKFLQRTELQPLELARKRFPRPELNELFDSLPASLSFLFVRHPFERIVSAYRNKLEGGRNSFYKALGHKIIQQFRKHGTRRRRTGPTFSEFLRYLIAQHKQQRRFDEHWAPVYSFCTPCSVNFTIIGKLETFQRDSEFIIRQAGLESLLLGKLPKQRQRKIGNQAGGVKTDALVERYFADVERDILAQLLKIYRLDFELFDYDLTKYEEMLRETGTTTPSATSAAIVGVCNSSTTNTITTKTMIATTIQKRSSKNATQ